MRERPRSLLLLLLVWLGEELGRECGRFGCVFDSTLYILMDSVVCLLEGNSYCVV